MAQHVALHPDAGRRAGPLGHDLRHLQTFRPLEKPLGGSFPALASHVHPGTRTPRNPADSLFSWRHAGIPTPEGIVHVPAEAVAGKYGTVSSHAATIVAVVTLSAAAIRRRWFTILGIVITLLICYSRIYLAKHFPIDLLLGAAVGLLVGGAAYWGYRELGRGFFKPVAGK